LTVLFAAKKLPSLTEVSLRLAGPQVREEEEEEEEEEEGGEALFATRNTRTCAN